MREDAAAEGDTGESDAGDCKTILVPEELVFSLRALARWARLRATRGRWRAST